MGSGRQRGAWGWGAGSSMSSHPESWAHPRPLHRVPRVPFQDSDGGAGCPEGQAPPSAETQQTSEGSCWAQAGKMAPFPGLRSACPGRGDILAWPAVPGPRDSYLPSPLVPVCSALLFQPWFSMRMQGPGCPQALRLPFTGVPDTSVGAAARRPRSSPASCRRTCEAPRHRRAVEDPGSIPPRPRGGRGLGGRAWQAGCQGAWLSCQHCSWAAGRSCR